MAYWAQIKNQMNKQQPQQKQILPVISTERPLIQTTLQGEGCIKVPASCTEQLVCTVFLPPETTAIKEFLEQDFNPFTKAFPIQSELCTYIPINIFTDQSERLHSHQSA